MSKKTKNTFYCFSPPIMIATFVIEVILALYTVFTRQMNKTTRIAVILIFCLAIFQFAEYGVCEQFGIGGINGSKLGFASITLLPPLGIHLVTAIANKKQKILIILSYLAALTWIGYFIFGDIMSGSVCKPNYVIFNIAEPFEGYYYFYYDVLLLVAILLGVYYAENATKKIKSALYILIGGYLAFIIPSIIFNTIDKYSGVDSPLPSIMCGFAIVLAVMIALGVVPLVSKKKLN